MNLLVGISEDYLGYDVDVALMEEKEGNEKVIVGNKTKCVNAGNRVYGVAFQGWTESVTNLSE